MTKLLWYDTDLLVDDFPFQLSDEFNDLNLHSKMNVIVDERVVDEVAEILVELDRNDVNEILEDGSQIITRLKKI